ncbi:MAG: aminotransferase class III-fold pyridoxal phosphate-dependent enzyme [Firmicutes bacterium]|nr:aminotransferase class III-fold pyridoxal phosphate-dependent enzyme [Bacillota bacterium]
MAENPQINTAEQITEQTIHNYEEYINPSLARLFRFMGLAVVEERAEGCYIYDNQGHKYLDCLGGYGAYSLGHRNPEVVEAVKSQIDRMPLSSRVLFNETVGKLAAKLAAITPGNLKYSFFCHSGTEAVEGALKMARLCKQKPGIISTINAFHGKTLGSLSATGRDVFRAPCEPLLPHFKHVPFGDAGAIAEAIDEYTAAVVLEPIQGEGGIIIPDNDYLPRVRKICDEKNVLLIIDEVQTGLARTGKMFAVEHWNVNPDIMCLAKALGGGVVPMGAFIATPEVWQVFLTSPFIHTSTLGGNPMAAAAALACIDVIEKQDLIGLAREKGQRLLEEVQKSAAGVPGVVAEVRGKGLMIGIELTKEGLGGFILNELIQDEIIVAFTFNNQKVIRLEPPLIINDEQLQKVISSIDSAFRKAAEVADEVE